MRKVMKLPLKQIISPDFQKKFLRHQSIGKFLYQHKVLNKIFNRISSVILSINNDRLRRESLETSDASKHGYTNLLPHTYGGLEFTLRYSSEISSPGFSENTTTASYKLYQEQLKTMRNLINQKRPKKVFNFGICYAYVDNELANEFPEIDFIGIDLSPHNKAVNDVDFSSTKNLTILSGDVFPHFSEIDYSDSIFFHSRTLLLLPREFIQKLYKSVYDANFDCIVGFEQNGLSEEISAPYAFDTFDKPSVYWRDRMYIHNYPYLAKAAGYEIQDIDLFFTPHTSPDFQILRFVAQRK